MILINSTEKDNLISAIVRGIVTKKDVEKIHTLFIKLLRKVGK